MMFYGFLFVIFLSDTVTPVVSTCLCIPVHDTYAFCCCPYWTVINSHLLLFILENILWWSYRAFFLLLFSFKGASCMRNWDLFSLSGQKEILTCGAMTIT